MHGPEMARQLLEIKGEEVQSEERPESPLAPRPSPLAPPHSPPLVTGYIGPPSLHWANRNHITLFVNGRWVKDNSLTFAVIQAYHTLLPTARYPFGLIFLTLPPEDVDVNVHPTKTEIRFRSKAPFGAVQRAVRETLISDSPIRSMTAWGLGRRSDEHTVGWAGSLDDRPFMRHDDEEAEQDEFTLDWSQPPSAQPFDNTSSPAPNPTLAGERLPIMRVVGQVGAAYIITEGPDGLFLIDQHAAHERILYEKFMAEWDNGQMAAQSLMAGTAVHLAPAQATLLEGNLAVLERLGFHIEPFGPNAFMVRAVPSLLVEQDPAQAVLDVVEDLERGDTPLQGKIEAKVIRRVCKTAAVKAGHTLSTAEMEALIRHLEACDNPHTCPHGRPTLIHLSVAQLARQFGRT
jgi:DNA mismatch repair protein MutL